MALLALENIRVAGLAGAGSVGTAWAALMMAKDMKVVVYDPSEGAAERLRAGVEAAWPALRALDSASQANPPFEALSFAASLEDMARQSDIVQENVAEALEIKRDVIAKIDSVVPSDRLILSSSGGVPPSQLQAFCIHPERLLLGHPFHPAYIVPLVEVVAGEKTLPEAVTLARRFYEKLGKHPITLQKEMTGHLSNRLQFALLREAIFCLSEGVASADDIDAAMLFGLGPRWAVMGPLMTFNLAGGDGGMEQILARFRTDVEGWWSSLGQPTLTPEVCDSLKAGAQMLRKGHSNAEWSAWRDRELVDFLSYRIAHPYAGDDLAILGARARSKVAR